MMTIDNEEGGFNCLYIEIWYPMRIFLTLRNKDTLFV